MSHTLITGASGFVGRALVTELRRRQVPVRAPVRSDAAAASLPAGVDAVKVGDLTALRDFTPLLAGVDTVLHLAARAHVTSDRGSANADLYHEVNERLTRRLATAARDAGVRRFVLVSSIKALGEANRGRPFQATDVPQPEDVYGRSKLAAEQALTEVCQGSPMGPVIVRPPLVYGPGVRANFLRIMRLVDRGVPLPLAGIDNRRSMISLDNLVDFLALCRESPAAVGRTWLVSDGDDLSSPELVRRLARAMQRRPRLLAVPVPLLRLLGRLTGFGGELQRLTDSLSVSIEPNRELLGWHPPVSVETGLRATVDAYLQRK